MCSAIQERRNSQAGQVRKFPRIHSCTLLPDAGALVTVGKEVGDQAGTRAGQRADALAAVNWEVVQLHAADAIPLLHDLPLLRILHAGRRMCPQSQHASSLHIQPANAHVQHYKL